MATLTSTLRLQMVQNLSGPSRAAAASLKDLEGAMSKLGKSGAKGAKDLVGQLEYLRRKAKDVGKFNEMRKGLADTAVQFRKAREAAKQLEKSFASTANPTRKMQSELSAARNALKRASSAFDEQKRAVRGAEQALRSYGLSGRSNIAQSQQKIRDEIAKTTRAMRKFEREAREKKNTPTATPREPGTRDAIVATGGAAVAYGAKRLATKSLIQAEDFDKAAKTRDAIGGLDAGGTNRLNDQAAKIGQATEFDNVDIVQGQTAIIQRGVRNVEQVENLTEAVVDYARALGVTVDEGAQSLTAMALVKGTKLDDIAAVRKLADRLAVMSKNSGMNDEDLRQFSKYGGASSKAVGISDDYFSAAGMVLRRAGIGGDEAGVAMRAAAAKLVAPTQKGRIALDTMGIDYDKFVKSPDSFSIKGFDAGLQRTFGKRLTPELRAQLVEAWQGDYNDPEAGDLPVKSNTGAFVTATTDVLDPLLKDMKPADLKKLAAYIGKFQQMSAESVDVMGLFDAILKADPTMIQSNGLFTEKQGGRLSILAQNRDGFYGDVEKLRNAPEGFAKHIGDQKMDGLYGDLERMRGSVSNAITKIAQDWEGPIRSVAQTIDGIADGFASLSTGSRRLVEAFGFAAAALMGAAAWRAGTGILGRFLGGGGAAATAGEVAAGAGAGATTGWLARAMPVLSRLGGLASLLTLSGSTPNNEYLNASDEERAAMRAESAKNAAWYNMQFSKKNTEMGALPPPERVFAKGNRYGPGDEFAQIYPTAADGTAPAAQTMDGFNQTLQGKADESRAIMAKLMADLVAMAQSQITPTIKPRVDMSAINGLHADTGVTY